MKRIPLIALLVNLLLIATGVFGYATEPDLISSRIGTGFAQRPSIPTSQATHKTTAELMAAVIERPALLQYPPLARAARISGKVEVEIVIDLQGNVESARAVSGHPLLRDAGVACAKLWKFEMTRLSKVPAEVIGTVTIVFDLQTDQREGLLREYPGAEWAKNIRLCREAIVKASPEATKLRLALANLAVSAVNENRVDEAIELFEEAGRQDKLPAEARPYYAKLLLDKHDYDLERAFDSDGKAPTLVPDGYLTQALELLLQAYSDESHAQPLDARKLVDIGRYIGRVYVSMGKPDERTAWMRVMLSSSEFPDSARAEISYELAVIHWQRAYDLTADYVRNNKPVPAPDVSKIRQSVDQGYSFIQLAQTLAPRLANPWFYQKLLILEDLKIETDPSRQELLIRRAMEAQDHYMALVKEQQTGSRGSLEENNRRPYASGLPSLNIAPKPLPPPPPPPPPPPRL